MMITVVHTKHLNNATSNAQVKLLLLASVEHPCYNCGMKLLMVLGVLIGGYAYVLTQTTNIVLGQTQQLQHTYQYVADNSDSILGE